MTKRNLKKVETRSADIAQDRLNQLRQLIPEAFVEGKIDFKKLQDALGHHIDDSTERYTFTWAGKRDAIRLLQTPTTATLAPHQDESIGFDGTSHIFIEGDNLEVLKLLYKAYFGKVKMIYIDPPYNTGSDFVYPDNYAAPLEFYLQITGQKDFEGNLLTSNTDSSGRFHSNWLNMMYPRLSIARQLLREDGVIFISIDDNEFHNLRLAMNEIFGEENFINAVSVKTKPSAGASGGGEDKRLKKNVEFVVIYARNKDHEERPPLRLMDVYEKTDLMEHIAEMNEEGKSWKYTSILTSAGNKEFIGTIQDGAGNDIKLFRHNDYERNTVYQLSKEIEKEKPKRSQESVYREIYYKYLDRIFSDTNAQSSIRTRVMEALGKEDGLFSIEYVPRSGKNKGTVTNVYYIGRSKRQVIWLSDIAEIDEGQLIYKSRLSTLWSNFNWNNVSKEGGVSFPNGKKPIALIQLLLELATHPDGEDIVFDFFAGSGSTAHAVLEQNLKDNGNRKYIVAQLPEPIIDEEFRTVAEIGKRRISSVVKKLQERQNGRLDLFDNDFGVRVFKLTPSHFKPWSGSPDADPESYNQQLALFNDPLIEGWQPEPVIWEIAIKEGYPLHSRTTQANVAGHTVYRVTNPDNDQQFHICLESEITAEIPRQLGLATNDLFICRDLALDDTTVANLALQCHLKTF